MAHSAIQEALNGKQVDWMEQVSDEYTEDCSIDRVPRGENWARSESKSSFRIRQDCRVYPPVGSAGPLHEPVPGPLLVRGIVQP